MSRFTVIQQANNTSLLMYDMGLSYYKGVINLASFPVELQSNYLEVINDAIEHFLIDSIKNPKIKSIFEFPETCENNNFLISFELQRDFVNIQRIIKIEVKKYVKTVDDYIREHNNKLSLNIKTTKENSTTIESQGKKIIELETKLTQAETEIKNLKGLVDGLNTSVQILLSQKNDKLGSGTTNIATGSFLPNTSINQATTSNPNTTLSFPSFNGLGQANTNSQFVFNSKPTNSSSTILTSSLTNNLTNTPVQISTTNAPLQSNTITSNNITTTPFSLTTNSTPVPFTLTPSTQFGSTTNVNNSTTKNA